MQTRDGGEGLHNCREFSQPLSCLYQAMQTRKTFSITYLSHFVIKKLSHFVESIFLSRVEGSMSMNDGKSFFFQFFFENVIIDAINVNHQYNEKQIEEFEKQLAH